MKNFKKLWKWLSRYKVRVWLALVLGIGTSAGSVLAALSIANILNAIIQQDTQGFLWNSLISAGLFMLSILSGYLYDRNATKIKQLVAYDIRMAMVESVEQATYRQYKTNKSEAYAAMLVTDLDIVSTRTLDTFFKIVQNFFNLVTSIVGLVYLHVSLLVTAFVLAALLFTLPGVFQGKMQVLAKQVAEKNNQLLVTASHWFGGFDVLNDVNAKSHIVSHVSPSIEAVKSTKIKDGNTTALVNMVSGTLSMVAQVAMIILTGYLALRGIVSSGTVLSTGNLAGMIFGPLSVLVMFYAQFQSGFGTLSHIEDTIAALTQPDAQTTALTLHEPASVTTSDLSVTFDDGRSVSLPNITATGNRHYAIVGPSGVGKSVFLNILAKNISDYTGELYVNDVALSTLSERSVKDLVAYVPQTTYIFNMTAKENILLANPTVTEAAYQEVVRLAGLQSVFEEWVNGDATLIGDTNTAISGGQAQRIGIARALIQQKPIMLFDEVTANLDPEVALAIEHVIHGIPNRLKLSVTHHLTQTNRALYDDVIEFKGTASS